MECECIISLDLRLVNDNLKQCIQHTRYTYTKRTLKHYIKLRTNRENINMGASKVTYFASHRHFVYSLNNLCTLEPRKGRKVIQFVYSVAITSLTESLITIIVYKILNYS